jgi:hypothetical protein
VDLGAEIPLDQGADPVLDLLGEDRVPLGGLFGADGVNVFVAHSLPYVLMCEMHTQSAGHVPTDRSYLRICYSLEGRMSFP